MCNFFKTIIHQIIYFIVSLVIPFLGLCQINSNRIFYLHGDHLFKELAGRYVLIFHHFNKAEGKMPFIRIFLLSHDTQNPVSPKV